MLNRLSLLLIPAGALLAIVPLLQGGSSCGHDFQFHLLNWLEVGAQWKQGVVLPRWEFTCAWNSGEPRFVFYPPISWVLGAFIGLLLPWAAVPIAFIWLTLSACGLATYRLARQWTDGAGALLAACFYMVHPYMMFTCLERSAFAELLAAAWMPLLLLSVLRRRLTILRIALPVTLLWLTNDPAAVMGCYALALLGIVRVGWLWKILRQRDEALRDAGRLAIGVCLGLALAGFYLIPAIMEQPWVHIVMAQVPGTSYSHNFLFGQFGGVSHRAILDTASLCSIALLALIAVLGAVAVSRSSGWPRSEETERRRLAIAALLILTAFLSFLLTASSAVLWRVVPELKDLQFPWRFDAVLGAAAAALMALALGPAKRGFSTVRLSTIRCWVIVACALAVSLAGGIAGNRFFRQFCGVENDVPGLVAAYDRGAIHDPTDEYTPRGSDPAFVGHNNPPAWIVSAPGDSPARPWAGPDPASLRSRLHFSVTSPTPAYLVVNLRDYPAWRVRVNGTLDAMHPHRTDGLLVVPIPAGKSVVNISYAVTKDFIAGCVTSLIALLLLLAIQRRHSRGVSSGMVHSASA